GSVPTIAAGAPRQRRRQAGPAAGRAANATWASSYSDRQAIGQRLSIGAPGGHSAHQQRRQQDRAQQPPFVAARPAERQIQSVEMLQRRLRASDADIQQHQSEYGSGQ